MEIGNPGETDRRTERRPSRRVNRCRRLRGLRANASRRSHAELETMTDLDMGDQGELGRQYAALRRRFSHINVLGGCCGTDHRHIEQICFACEAVA